MNADPILTEPFEVRNRLAELGIDEEDLSYAVTRGAAAGFECNDNHPPQSAGYYRWAETTAAIRERSLPKDWERISDDGLPLTVNSTGTVALTVAGGDENTGRAEKTPSTKSQKGPRISSAVADNSQFEFLFDGVPLRPEHLVASEGRMTWVLLIYVDKCSYQIRSELSRPKTMSDDRRIVGWWERIILKSIPFDGDALNIPVEDAPKTPELDGEIRRRA
jgi:hypothetical protein